MSLGACGGGPSEEDVRRSQAEYDLGVGLMQEQNVAGAFQHLREAVRLDPDNAEAHLVLGTLLMLRGDHPEAERELREALRANTALGGAGLPSLTPEAHNTLGVLYLNTRRYDDAVRELRIATGDELNRTPHLAWGNLGWAYLELGDLSEAELALSEAVRREPRYCAGWFFLARVHSSRGTAASEADAEAHFRAADDALTHALEVDLEECRRLQDAWRLRGETRARLGRSEESVADFERCVELDRETESGRACSGFLEASP
ncbi:TPR domain protein, putative component of TonB system [Sandaracinus amylolyticus]|nr:TPR domain protein, putative component of TonB system [Sandaracinus amylolyticus]